MDTVLSSVHITTRDTPKLNIPTANLPPNDPSHIAHIPVHAPPKDPVPYHSTHPNLSQQDNKCPASFQSYRPDNTNQVVRYNEPITQEETLSISSRQRQRYRSDPSTPIAFQVQHAPAYNDAQRSHQLQWQPSQSTSPPYNILS